MTFEEALAIVLKHEGGYSDHPSDPGGATNLGITLRTLARWLGRAVTKDEVKALTFTDVKPIYEAWYWDRCRCFAMPPGVDLMLFDAAVNHGATRARKMLQEAVHARQDGIIGPMTMKAVEDMDREALLCEFAAIRADLYETINERFERGWFRRLMDIFLHALKAGAFPARIV